MFKTEYLLMREIAWPRAMMVDIAQEFAPKKLVRPSKTRKFTYIKRATTQLYIAFENYHDNEISKKSWTGLFKFGLLMKTGKQNGKNYFYAGPEAIVLINRLLDEIPDDGGFFFDGSHIVSVVNRLEAPEIKVPEITIKENNTNEKTIKSGKVIRG